MKVELTYTNGKKVQLTYDGSLSALYVELIAQIDLGEGQFGGSSLRLVGGVIINTSSIRQIEEISENSSDSKGKNN